MLAMANKNGCVFGSPPGLANRARVSLECVLSALAKFQAPDQYSRTKEYDGRRIEEIDGGWKLLNYAKHREIKDEEDRNLYMRDYMREYRTGQPVNSVNTEDVNTCKHGLTQAEAEAEADTEKPKVRTFVPPRLSEVIAYCAERKNRVDPQHWFDYYTANGWKVGRASMRDWRAAIRTWERNRNGNGGSNGFKTAAQSRNERSSANLERAWSKAESAKNVPSDLFKGTH